MVRLVVEHGSQTHLLRRKSQGRGTMFFSNAVDESDRAIVKAKRLVILVVWVHASIHEA